MHTQRLPGHGEKTEGSNHKHSHSWATNMALTSPQNINNRPEPVPHSTRNSPNCISHCNKSLPFPTNKNREAGCYTNRTFLGCRDKHRQKNPRKPRAPKQNARLCRSHHGELVSFCFRRFQCMPCTGRANGDYSVVGLGATRWQEFSPFKRNLGALWNATGKQNKQQQQKKKYTTTTKNIKKNDPTHPRRNGNTVRSQNDTDVQTWHKWTY